ncbi:LysR family transcriptional regulator [Streptomyces sp. NPDC101152]|uniref:LysR family transcriptional regulator n=1 Tax=Streptomyces sp. NPDC101152 TaxID=3366116 RepID=UPI0037F4E30B
MDTTRLRVFREVTRQGSFTAAADVLHISQPAVSQHVAKLEQELGCRLLERSPRRVRPTSAGEVFLRHVESLLAGLDDARRELAALTRSDCGQLRLTVFPSAVATFVPSAVGAFRAAFPKVRTVLTEADPPIALARLLAGDTDLAVVYDYPLVGAPVDPRFDQTLIVADPMAVAVRADSAFAAHGSVPLAALSGQEWIAPGPSMCRDALNEACRRTGFGPNVVSETNDYQAMLGLVEAGVGVAVVPRLVGAMARSRSIALVPLAATRLQRVVSVACRSGSALTPAMEFMRSMLCGALAGQHTEVREVDTPALSA